ncbi:MAG: hypothetical protein Q4C70_11970 [Planctomycetia bacterium]|nr:hypothetical protein [Planctomycetia bacterium]
MNCTQCGGVMSSRVEGNTLIWTCSQCDNCLMTTWFPEIETDSTEYTITLEKSEDYDADSLRFVAQIANCNFLQAKEVLLLGKENFLTARATRIREVAHELTRLGTSFHINPEFSYDY